MRILSRIFGTPELTAFQKKQIQDLSDALIKAEAKQLNFKEFYSKFESDIFIHLDALDGVTTTIGKIEVDQKSYPDSFGYIRDATKAIPLDKRIKQDDPRRELQNLVLRALNTLRGIDHVLEVRSISGDHTQKQNALLGRIELLKALNALVKNIHASNALEVFNTSLIATLNKNGLAPGFKSKEYEKLLTHYRDLASVIEPAKSMQTIIYDEWTKITHTETAIPITEKIGEPDKAEPDKKAEPDQVPKGSKSTAESKQVESQYKQINDFVKNTKNDAFRYANEAFAELIKDNKRRLPAQTRKTFGPTVKNGYVVHNQLSRVGKDGHTIVYSEPLWSLRCGSMVYVGDDASPQQIEAYTTSIVAQLKKAIKNLNISDKTTPHFIMLITNSSKENQDKMYAVSKRVIAASDAQVTHASTNFQGAILEDIEVAEKLKKEVSQRGIEIKSMDRAERYRIAAEIFWVANEKGQIFINVVFCASGQDRTGTENEIAVQLWTQRIALSTFEVALYIDNLPHLAKLRALGRHNAVLASLAAPGSPNMKWNSQAGGLLPKEVDEVYYSESAETNKGTSVGKKAVKQVMKAKTSYLPVVSSKETMEQKDIDQFIAEVERDICTLKPKNQDKIDILKAVKGMIDEYKEKDKLWQKQLHDQKQLTDQFLSSQKGNESQEKKQLDDGVPDFKTMQESFQASHDRTAAQYHKLREECVKNISLEIGTIWTAGESKHARKQEARKQDALVETVTTKPKKHPTTYKVGAFLQKWHGMFPKVIPKIIQSYTAIHTEGMFPKDPQGAPSSGVKSQPDGPSASADPLTLNKS